MCPRILVVEGDAMIRGLIKNVLELDGHTVDEAATVEEAWHSLDRLLPDLVLEDVQVPNGGGEAVLRHIKDNPASAHVQVIAVTAQAMRGDRERLLAAGFDGYLSKPPENGTFSQSIRDLLERSQQRPPGEGMAQLEAHVAALRQRLLQELPARIEALTADLVQLRQSGPDRAALEGMQRRAHSLHGIAASFELDVVAGLARRLEATLPACATMPLEALLPVIEQLIRELARAGRQIAPGAAAQSR